MTPVGRALQEGVKPPTYQYNKINNIESLSHNKINELIDITKIKQLENNNIYKNDKLKYLNIFFKNEIKTSHKIIFIKWINNKKGIALVYFPEYSLELLTLYQNSHWAYNLS